MRISGDYWRLLGITGEVGITGDHWQLLDTTGDSWILLEITGDYWILLGTTQYIYRSKWRLLGDC